LGAIIFGCLQQNIMINSAIPGRNIFNSDFIRTRQKRIIAASAKLLPAHLAGRHCKKLLVNGHMKVELRQATADDIPFLWEVFRLSMRDYITQTRGEWNEQREECQFRHQLDLPATHVIRSNNLEVGFIMFPMENGARWIHTVCIAPEHQNRGVGTEVIRLVIAESEKQEMELFLSVLKVNPARRLYERLGFRVIEEAKHHLRMQFHATSKIGS
jgi:ribosomal protein S18 acetylase RimI-like enzyme